MLPIIWSTVSAPDNDDDCGADDEMIGSEMRSTRVKPGTVLLCPPPIPHALTWDLPRADSEGTNRMSYCLALQPSVQKLSASDVVSL
jgi:hypothetical protein